MTNTTQPVGFADLGLAASLVDAVKKIGVTAPTPIQHQAIPPALTGADVVGIAQTGTGKTFAFGLPMLQNISKNKGQGLIILPTRELAIQVEESLRKVGGRLGVRTAVLIGGEPIGKQIRQLKAKPHIIICTPGRINDHLEQRTVRLDQISIVVLDEADRMLDMGFLPQIKRVLETVPEQRQTMLFSATMPAEIFKLAAQFMQKPVRIEVVPAGTASQNVEQEVIFLDGASKQKMLEEILKEEKGTVLVFSKTKHGAKRIARTISMGGIQAVELHGNLSLAQRKRSMTSFKSGQARVLVATDIAARGIDVTGISLVINYDLPMVPEDYVHRIGRTGRAGMSGKAIAFATPDQVGDIMRIERVMNKKLTRSTKSAPVASPAPRSQHSGGGYRGGSSYGGGSRQGSSQRSSSGSSNRSQYSSRGGQSSAGNSRSQRPGFGKPSNGGRNKYRKDDKPMMQDGQFVAPKKKMRDPFEPRNYGTHGGTMDEYNTYV